MLRSLLFRCWQNLALKNETYQYCDISYGLWLEMLQFLNACGLQNDYIFWGKNIPKMSQYIEQKFCFFDKEGSESNITLKKLENLLQQSATVPKSFTRRSCFCWAQFLSKVNFLSIVVLNVQKRQSQWDLTQKLSFCRW